MSLSLSILDQSPIVAGRDPGASIRETLALAKAADRLGYRRYWMAEHHNSAAQAGTAPEILIAAIAATTQRIRIGSAGVMLPHYASLKIAEQFRVLEAIAPGRIDLGLGRAPGSDGQTAYALNPDAARAADRFPQQVMELIGWTGEGLPVTHPFAAIRAQPEVPTRPEIWILGSSDYGAQVAAHFGLPYCFAHFITDGRGAAEALAIYRERFRPGVLAAPHAAVAVAGLCAETEEEAWRLWRPREAWRLDRDRGIYRPLMNMAEAAAWSPEPADLPRIERGRARALVGTAPVLLARLEALAAELEVAEIAVLTPCPDTAGRARSYALLAEAAGLGAMAKAAE
ncbi:luciferase family oxidoreductase group 1 [Humitalea rosea]|uniref:Luciferase-like monooxygenase n=1 Tax=Humitalea rosea TaxID=990373 RepID=A0A2W7HZA0_9PROT|nr:LLM class flavin-dependent oxidoreductase [Humitalea rosea]PZW39866.1 luciferase family oxidoreductase group 1 [Humitalea rosea]